MHLWSARLAVQQLYGIRTDVRVGGHRANFVSRYTSTFGGEKRHGNIKYLEKFIDLLIHIESFSDNNIDELRMKLDDRMTWLEVFYIVVKDILASGPSKDMWSLNTLYREALLQISLEDAHYAC